MFRIESGNKAMALVDDFVMFNTIINIILNLLLGDIN